MSGENVCNICLGEPCRCNVTLTPAQRAFLELVEECTPPAERAVRHEFNGAVARGATLRCATRLEALGLVTYVGHGPVDDEDHDKEWPIYAVTDAGRATLRRSEDPR